MTNEEAIEILSSVGDINRCCSDDAEALDMAIKALEAQEIRCDSNMEEVAKSFIEDVETVKDQLDGQPCEDWYDVPSDEMTLEQARQAVKDLRKRLAEYLEQQPCEDVLDKIKAEIIEKFDNCSICEWFENYDYDENDISEYMSVGHILDIIDIIDKYKAESEDK